MLNAGGGPRDCRPQKWWIAGGTLGLLVAALAAFLLLFDWNWVKAPIEDRITSATGRRFEIRGDVTGEWRLHPVVRMAQVRFANPAWAASEELLTADIVEVRIAVLPLLAGHIHILGLALTRPTVNLERLRDGRATWRFDRTQLDGQSTPRIDALRVDDGVINFQDAVTDTKVVARLRDIPDEGKPPGVTLEVAGKYRGQPLALKGTTAPVLALQAASRRLPILATGTIAGTQVAVHGEIDGLTRFEHVALNYHVQGRSLRLLAPVFAVPLPETPPYDVAGVLTRNGNRWETTDLKGKVGSSEVAGKVMVATGGARPFLEAALTSSLLDLADLGPLIGAGPAATLGKPNDAARLFPTREFDLSRIRELDAHVTLKARQVVHVADFPFDDFEADLRLQDARITIDPLQFGMAGGNLRGRVTLDARQPAIAAALTARMRDVRVVKIFQEKGAVGEAAGTLAGFIDLRGQGKSVSAMLATADGRASLLLADGRIPSVLPAIADLDGARVIASFLGKRPESVQCSAIDLRVAGGVATPNVAVFETETTVLNAAGSLDLRDEKLDLKVIQAPKKVSFLSLRTPLLVTGTLRAPRFGVDPAPLAARAAAAVVLGLINPLAAVFALLETGPGEDGTCPEIRRGLKTQAPPAKIELNAGDSVPVPAGS
jgi:uncharacterized protein involved in outer membrane biogenesis